MITKLRSLGLSEYEAKSYLALLTYGTQQGKDVAKHSGVPPTRVFDALHSLTVRGLASKVQEKPLLFKAIPPSQAIKALIRSQQQDLRILEEDLLTNLKQIKKETTVPKVTEKISILPGYESLWEFVSNSLNTAKKELKMMFTYEQRPSKVLSLFKKALNRGIKIKIIATKMTEASLPMIKEHIKLGAEVRFYPVEEIRITVKDGKEALIGMVNPRDRHDRVNIIIESLELSKALDHYFDTLWKKAKLIKQDF